MPADIPEQRNISPDMAGLISGQRENINKLLTKNSDMLTRGDSYIHIKSQLMILKMLFCKFYFRSYIFTCSIG